ncbi:MAG: PD-(D/E)XK nuclease family protein [Proteobacteria bacterium]|nr:PD-(D/E)XK nuclease family protein [Pseudomonadota bacterium]
MPIFSHSRLSSFENCPKQFHFRYVLKIPAESESIEAFVGKRVHEVLERLYQFAGQGMVPSLEKVLHRYHALFDEAYDAERIRVVRAENPVSHYRDLGGRCLTNYYRHHYPFDADETLGLEARVLFPLDDMGRYRFQGFIDRLVRSRDGAIEIHDYKTGRYVPSQKRLDSDRQLALYQLGVQKQYGTDQPIRLVWHYVSRGQRRVSTRTPEALETLRQETIALIDRVHAETEFPPRKIPLCDWCEYKAICPLWNEGVSPPPKPTKPVEPDDRQLDLLDWGGPDPGLD